LNEDFWINCMAWGEAHAQSNRTGLPGRTVTYLEALEIVMARNEFDARFNRAKQGEEQ
jgi:hypothetical protein